jgi:hypothetical protein
VRIVVGVLGIALILFNLAEFFVVFLLPRRVKRDPRMARIVLGVVWRPWRKLAAQLSPASGDTMLGVFGPFGLIVILSSLSAGVILGFAGMHWGHRSHLGGVHAAGFVNDLYFSAASFFSAAAGFSPRDGLAKFLNIAEAGTGFAVLFISIGYLPALFQAFSRRETAVSQLDPRAGSPSTAGALLERSGSRGGWPGIDGYLGEWETWSAELMETHLSYPILGYFRSQHVNQNWLSALTTVVDASAFSMAYAPAGVQHADLTFAIGRHALADLSFTFRTRAPSEVPNRLPDSDLEQLVARLRESGLELTADDQTARRRLTELRGTYERYVYAIGDRLALPVPGWLPGEDAVENWRLAIAGRPRRTPLP